MVTILVKMSAFTLKKIFFAQIRKLYQKIRTGQL